MNKTRVLTAFVASGALALSLSFGSLAFAGGGGHGGGNEGHQGGGGGHHGNPKHGKPGHKHDKDCPPSSEPTTTEPTDEPSTTEPTDEPSTTEPTDEPTTSEPTTSEPTDEPTTTRPVVNPPANEPPSKNQEKVIKKATGKNKPKKGTSTKYDRDGNGEVDQWYGPNNEPISETG